MGMRMLYLPKPEGDCVTWVAWTPQQPQQMPELSGSRDQVLDNLRGFAPNELPVHGTPVLQKHREDQTTMNETN